MSEEKNNTNNFNKVLNIILTTVVLVYLLAVLNAFILVKYEDFIKHFYWVGYYLLYLLIPVFYIKYLVKNRFEKKELNKNNEDKLWKKEINIFTRSIFAFFTHNIGLFLMTVIIAHILSYSDAEYRLSQLLNNWGFDAFQGYNIWKITVPYLICVWLFSAYVLFLSKGKFKHIFPKKIFLFCLFVGTIVFTYNINFLISTNLHTEIYSKLYAGVVNTNTKISTCENGEIICIKIKEQDLVKEKDNFVPKNSKDNLLIYPELTKSAEYIINKYIEDIQSSKKETVLYYFTSKLSLKENDEWFATIIAYNKKTELLIVDYKTGNKIINKEKYNKQALIGLSTLIWVCLILFLTMFHDIFVQWRKKVVKDKEVKGMEVIKND